MKTFDKGHVDCTLEFLENSLTSSILYKTIFMAVVMYLELYIETVEHSSS